MSNGELFMWGCIAFVAVDRVAYVLACIVDNWKK